MRRVVVTASQLADPLGAATGPYYSSLNSSRCSDDTISNRIKKMEMEISHLKKKNQQIALHKERTQQIQLEKQTMKELRLQK